MADESRFPAPSAAGPEPSLGAVTVRVEGVHVRYVVAEDRKRSLREVVTVPWKPRRLREVHALKGVSFTAHAGEVVGIIGPNGSGKSTLMRVVAGLQPVAQGAVYASSTPMLLGVGAVLNKTLSGRRNILLGGLALGMTKAEVQEREANIIEFAEIGPAIDLPMRTYSSGMAARLQFAISAAVEPEILIVDEALAVGDQAFRQKSAERIDELRKSAGTVFLVSHSMSSIRQICTRVLWVQDGELVMDDAPNVVVPAYQGPLAEQRRRRRQRQRRRRKRLARLAAEAAAAEGAEAGTAIPQQNETAPNNESAPESGTAPGVPGHTAGQTSGQDAPRDDDQPAHASPHRT